MYKFPPKADESGKVRDDRIVNYNMYWILFKLVFRKLLIWGWRGKGLMSCAILRCNLFLFIICDFLVSSCILCSDSFIPRYVTTCSHVSSCVTLHHTLSHHFRKVVYCITLHYFTVSYILHYTIPCYGILY